MAVYLNHIDDDHKFDTVDEAMRFAQNGDTIWVPANTTIHIKDAHVGLEGIHFKGIGAAREG